MTFKEYIIQFPNMKRDIIHLNISDLIGIDEFEFIEKLDISANNISDISPLYLLKKLKVLDISNNPISNIDIILDMNTLQGIYIYNKSLPEKYFGWTKYNNLNELKRDLLIKKRKRIIKELL